MTQQDFDELRFLHDFVVIQSVKPSMHVDTVWSNVE